MILSLCIPTMNRTHTLRQVLPKIVAAANASPPCEIVILDYNSTDGFAKFIETFRRLNELAEGNFWTIQTILNREYYQPANARNLSILISHGEYFIELSADAMPMEDAFGYIRYRIEDEHPVWMCEGYIGRFIVCQRDEFIAAGGYDERFNVYGPEDRDLCARLHRRCGKFERYPAYLIDELPTSNVEKMRWMDKRPYTEQGLWIKRQMHRAMMRIFEENIARHALTANEGRAWGQ